MKRPCAAAAAGNGQKPLSMIRQGQTLGNPLVQPVIPRAIPQFRRIAEESVIPRQMATEKVFGTQYRIDSKIILRLVVCHPRLRVGRLQRNPGPGKRHGVAYAKRKIVIFQPFRLLLQEIINFPSRRDWLKLLQHFPPPAEKINVPHNRPNNSWVIISIRNTEN